MIDIIIVKYACEIIDHCLKDYSVINNSIFDFYFSLN